MGTTAIVVAGGKSLRLGRDKASEIFNGESLLERTVHRLSIICDHIIVSVTPGQSIPNFPGLSIERVVDLYPGRGSIVGIYSGLVKSPSFHSIVVACDMPFLNTALLQYMSELSHDFDIVVPKIGDWFEPLHAIYSKNCLTFMQEFIEHDNLRVTDLFNSVRVRAIEQAEIERFDPEHLSFFNINSQIDLERAREMTNEANKGGNTRD